jgi:hypothetical protein
MLRCLDMTPLQRDAWARALTVIGFASCVASAQSHTASPAAGIAARAGVSGVTLPSRRRERVSMRGTVRTIRPWPTVTHWWDVEIDGSGALESRTLRLYAESRDDVPLREHDTIDADVDCTRGGWHYVCSVVVRDAAGALLFAVAASGEAIPGWTASPAPRSPTAHGRQNEPLVLEHDGHRVTTDPTHWRALDASDGRWSVLGYASRSYEDPRPPESVDYDFYAVRRIGRAP